MNLEDFAFPDLTEVTGAPLPLTKRPLLTPHETIPDDYVLQLDNTTASIFQTCPRASKFYTINRRQRPDRAPLIFGGAIHEGLEHVYKHGFEAEKAACLKILEHFERHPFNSVGEWRTPAYAVESFRKYVAYWSLMDTFKPYDLGWVEKAFALNIGEFSVDSEIPFTRDQLLDDPGNGTPLFIKTLHVQYTGKIDLVHQDPDGLLYVVDHKTSSMGGPTFFQDFELSQQTHGYMWAVQEMLGRPVAGFILNALLIRKPSKTGVGHEFDRKHYFYTQEAVAEWKTDMIHSVESFVHSLTNDAFPKFTAWCMGKYGRCQYHDVCTLPANQRHMMLMSDQYSNVTWSPLNND